jgi:phosphate-selective porin OprO/OprP
MAICLLVIASSAKAAGLSAEYKKGLRLTSEDGAFQWKAGGRLHFDNSFLNGDDDAGNAADGVEFRRARVFVAGHSYSIMEFKFQLDFAKGSASFKDAYMGLKTTPLAGFGVRVGQFHQPFGLETLTSSNYMSFIERAQLSSFAPDRQAGILLHRDIRDGFGTVAVSAFRHVSSQGKGTGDGLWNGAGRLSLVPWKGEEKGDLIHVGVAVARRQNSEDMLELELAPESHLSPEYGNLALAAENWNQFGSEAALVFGSLSVQGEFALSKTSAPDQVAKIAFAEDATLSSYYGFVSFFVTGEKRTYKSSAGVFNRVSPSSNYDGKGGRGALELVARYSSTDLDDGDLKGGSLDAVTLGANWYLNPNARVMFNYVRSDGSGGDVREGVENALLTRFQIDF